MSGYGASPWPAEDGGPARLQAVPETLALGLQPGERLRCISRPTLLSTMTVLGAPGEVFVLTHSALRARIGLPTTACVERIDPVTLAPQRRSPRLAGGPMWPGGMALAAHGDLLVVYGRYAHRLDRDCQVQASHRLAVDEAYNSFVLLDNGLLVCKNLSRHTPARLSVLDPWTLEEVDAIEAPGPSVARLSAQGLTVYVLGLSCIWRYHWDEGQGRLRRDEDWQVDYGQERSHAWDGVLAGDTLWFMDNGEHRYLTTMRAAGVHPGDNRLQGASLRDGHLHTRVSVCGLPHGSITNPPLVDPRRRIVVAFDSAHDWLRAWRITPDGLQDLWQHHPFGCASHMLLYPASGELVLNDHRRTGEQVVVLDMESGQEKGRVRVGGWTQGVVFPAPGWQRDFYWSSMSRLARIFVD